MAVTHESTHFAWNNKFNKLFYLLFAIAVMAMSFILITSHDRSPVDVHKFRDTIFDPYLNKHSQQEWWMRTQPIDPSRPAVLDLLNEKITEIDNVLRKYKSFNEITAKNARLLRRYGLEIANGDAPLRYLPVVDGYSKVMLRFFTLNELHQYATVCMYERLPGKTPAINIAAIAIPSKVLPAFIEHEAGHASLDDGKKAGEATPAEEIMLHRLGGKLLNAETSGKYFALVQKIATRKARDWSSAIANITEADLAEMDEMLDMQDSGMLVAAPMITQLEINVGLKYIEVHQLPKVLEAELYQWICEP